MHPNRRFHWDDRDEMLGLVAELSFGAVFATGPDGPSVAHVPVIVARRPDRLRFHIARSNGLVRVFDVGAIALAVFTGPEAYVSPDWYGTPDQVPTWNYIAVECEGTVRRLDQTELVQLLDDLSETHEARLAPKKPWTRSKMTPGRFEAMLPAIIGFELTIEAMRGTVKLGQNKRPDEITGAIKGLEGCGRRGIATLMRQWQESEA